MNVRRPGSAPGAMWQRLWPALLLLLVTIGFYWKITLSKQYYWLDLGDVVYQVLPWLQFETATWQSGSFPLWDPRLWGGQPVAGQVQPGVLNPLNWILFSVPLKHGFIRIGTLNWYFVLIHYLAALFTYLCCRGRGLSRLASIFGACSFAFGGFMATVIWPQILMSALWLPLILLFLLRVDDGRRPIGSAALAGALLGIAFLSGHHNVPMFATVCAAAFWAYYLLASHPLPVRTRLLTGGVFATCFLTVSAAQILPAVELGKWSVRWAGALSPLTWGIKVPYSVHDTYSLYPTSILGFAIPGFSRHTDTFVGLVVLACAAFGAVLCWQRRGARIATALAALGLLLALGSDSLLHGIVYQLWPGFDKARNPSMAIALCHIGLALLAAYGLEACFKDAERAKRLQAPAAKILTTLAVSLYALLIVLITVRSEQAREYRVLAITALNALLLAGVLAAWLYEKIPNTLAGILLIALAAGEMHPVATFVFRHQDQPSRVIHKLEQHQDIAAYLRGRPEVVRVEVDSNEIPYNFGDWYGIDQANGYVPGILQSVYALIVDPRRPMLFGTNYYVGRNPKTSRQALVYTSSSGLNVYRDPDALPRVRTVHQAIGAPDDRAVVSAMRKPELNLVETAVVEGTAPMLEVCAAPDVVQLAEYTANRVMVDARMSCRGILILGDAWFPGWNVYVDGQPAPMLRVCSIVRGVAVNGGAHRVTFRYQPVTLYAGLAMTLLGLAICAVAVLGPFDARLARRTTERAGL